MKASTVTAALAPSVASAQWWNGAPECAQSCLSSAWSSPTGTVTVTSWWPAQSEYCDTDQGNSVGDCINNACTSTSTAFSSYSSLSSSLCSRYESCTSAGSTGVQTITYPGGPVTWAAPGGWGGGQKAFPGGHGFPGDGPGGGNISEYSQYWSEWASAYSGSKTWTGGVATVTGCAFDGSPWFVGPGCGWNGQGGFDGWVGWGSGWSWGPTQTETVTVTTTDEAGSQTTQTGVATVALAVSGGLTTSTTLGAVAAETSDASGNAAPRLMAGPGGAEGSAVTVLMGVALGAVVAVAGML
ncbi:hypothetical protein F5X99DRAFT_427680 [Biscogniauxia marginata]|nr:hypothetical protein F5X99DRAFT_427680 [Biscogniauxia marginata]